MDGTLYSSEPLIERVYKESVDLFNQKYGKSFSAPSFSQIEPLIGQPVQKIYETLFPQITREEKEALGNILIRNFELFISNEGGTLFQGVVPLLLSLKEKGYTLLVASNGKREYLQAIIDKFSLPFAPFVCVEEQGIERKGQILEYYLNSYNESPDALVMIGDRSSDFDAARQTGCFFIGCCFGHGPIEEIKDADALVEKVEDIALIIENAAAAR